MSKISVQSQNGTIQQLRQLLTKQPIAYKLLGNSLNIGIAADIRRISPTTFIVLRTGGNWAVDDDAYIRRYADEASRLADPFLQAGLCDLLEPANEPVVQTVELAKTLNFRQVQYADLMRSRGYRVGAYNFSVGNPEYSLWPYLWDGVRASEGWLLLHEYGAPTMQANAADLSLRHRRVYELCPDDLKAKLKIGITETGIDLGAIGGAGGYRRMPEPPNDRRIIDVFLDQLGWYDGELAQDGYVKFATLFGYGMNEPWTGLGFDLADVEEDRLAYIGWQGAGTVALDNPPVITPPPPPPPAPSFAFTSYPLPARAPISQGFGANPASYAPFGLPGHEGIDLAVVIGTPVLSVAQGTVAQVAFDANTYGNFIRVNHVEGWQTTYGHLDYTGGVFVGQVVTGGQQLGLSGNSGNSSGPHLHLTLKWLNHFYTDAAGVLWPFNIVDPTLRLASITPTPMEEPKVSTPQERINAAWKSEGVQYNPGAAFPKKALALGLGRAVADEYRYTAADGKHMAGQGFDAAFLETEEGQFSLDSIKAYDWLTGELWSAPVPTPAPTPAPTTPHLDVLPESARVFRIGYDKYPAKAGEAFYGLVGVSEPKIDVEVRFVFNVLNAAGGQAVNAACYHVWDGGYECFPAQGLTEVDLGGGSWYQWSPPNQTEPKDRFYVGAKMANRDLGEPPAPPISDVIRYGLPDHRHLSATFTFQLMTG